MAQLVLEEIIDGINLSRFSTILHLSVTLLFFVLVHKYAHVNQFLGSSNYPLVLKDLHFKNFVKVLCVRVSLL